MSVTSPSAVLRRTRRATRYLAAALLAATVSVPATAAASSTPPSPSPQPSRGATATPRATLPDAASLAAQARAVVSGATAAAARPVGRATKLVSYAGVELKVPAGWPVYDLAAEPTRCVRFDVHAVYLGVQGPDAICPAHAIGRSSAVQISRYTAATTRGLLLDPTPSTLGGQPVQASPYAAQSHTLTVAFPHLGVVVRASYGADRPLADSIVGSARVMPTAAPAMAPAAWSQSSPTSSPSPSPSPTPSGPSGPPAARPAVTLTGQGFDTCAAPSTGQMNAWWSSPYRGIGIYVGGANRACGDGNLSSSWVTNVTVQGWRLMPLYVGLQSPCVYQPGLAVFSTNPSTAASQAVSAAQDAVARMQAFGLPKGNPVYFDMEAYATSNSSCLAATNSFIGAWTSALHQLGYRSGVYSGPIQLDALLNSSAVKPDNIWFAHWNGVNSVFGDPYLPDWAWRYHQRIHQYVGGHNETYGGVTLNIDTNVVDADVAPAVPPAPPSAPNGVAATPMSGGATVTWSQPAQSGSSAVDSYTVTVQPGGGTVTVPYTQLGTTIGGLSNGTTYSFSVVAHNNVMTGPASVSNSVVPLPPPAASGYHPVTPVRVLDTRIGLGAPRAQLTPWQSVTIRVAGVNGVPSNATAVVLNVVAVNATSPGFLVVYRSGGSSGTNLWYPQGSAEANLVTVRVGPGGTATLRAMSAVNVLADLQGYYTAGSGSLYTPVQPTRIVDTRYPSGGFTTIPGNGSLRLPLLGHYGIPTNATAVALDVTPVNESGYGWLAVYGRTVTSTSNINYAPGTPTTNLVLVAPAADGSVTIHPTTTSDVVVTLVGYYGPSGTSFYPSDVQRVLDTRIGLGGSPPVTAGGTITFQVAGVGAVPAGVSVVAMDVTLVNPAGGGYLMVYPPGGSGDTSMTFSGGRVTTALVFARVASNGTVTLRSSAASQVVVDVDSWFR